MKLAMGLVSHHDRFGSRPAGRRSQGLLRHATGRSRLQLAAKTAFLDRLLEVYGSRLRVAGTSAPTLASAEERLWNTSGVSRRSSHWSSQGVGRIASIPHPKTDAQRRFRAGRLPSHGSRTAPLVALRTVGSSISARCSSWLHFMAGLHLPQLRPSPQTTQSPWSPLLVAVSVAGSIFLIFELDRPFSGFIQIPRRSSITRCARFDPGLFLSAATWTSKCSGCFIDFRSEPDSFGRVDASLSAPLVPLGTPEPTIPQRKYTLKRRPPHGPARRHSPQRNQ